jgi:hypothetical protein
MSTPGWLSGGIAAGGPGRAGKPRHATLEIAEILAQLLQREVEGEDALNYIAQ